MKTGDLIKSLPYGLGIVIYSWENQKIFPGVPPHDENDLMVMFPSGTVILKKDCCKLVSKG